MADFSTKRPGELENWRKRDGTANASYCDMDELRLTKLKRGLILNFNRPVMKAGIKRISL